MYPIDALKAAGVDLTDPGVIETAFDVLTGLIDKLEQLV
jgi:oligoendopeptidase F